MSILTPETRTPEFWHQEIFLADSEEKRWELAGRIATMITLAEGVTNGGGEDDESSED